MNTASYTNPEKYCLASGWCNERLAYYATWAEVYCAAALMGREGRSVTVYNMDHIDYDTHGLSDRQDELLEQVQA